MGRPTSGGVAAFGCECESPMRGRLLLWQPPSGKWPYAALRTVSSPMCGNFGHERGRNPKAPWVRVVPAVTRTVEQCIAGDLGPLHPTHRTFLAMLQTGTPARLSKGLT